MDDRYLFKAKRIDNGEWVQGYLYGIWEKRYILWGMTNDVPDMIEVDPSTICQCTGLKEKNGNLIWENDIVKFKRSDDKEFVGEISYVEHYGAFFVIHSGCSDNQLYAFGDYEVIGNIFDNPELLESEE